MPDEEQIDDRFDKELEKLKEELEQKSKELEDSIKKESSGLEKEGNDIQDDTERPIVEFDIDVSMKPQTWIMHLPQVAMRDQEWSFDVPQVTMKRQDWIFHTPSVRMVTKKTGEKPEFYCDTGSFIPKCTVKWTPIYIDVPEPFLEEQKISLDVPEFTWDTTSIIIKVPEFTWEETQMKLHVPEFKVNSIRFNWPPSVADDAQERGDALKEKANDLERRSAASGKKLEKEFRSKAISIVSQSIRKRFSSARDELENKRIEAMTKFNESLAMLKGIEDAVSGKENAEFRGQLQENRKSLLEQQKKATLQFDGALKELLEREKEVISNAVEQQGLTPVVI